MKKSGCIRLLFGVESGSEKLLKYMHKKIDFNNMYNIIRETIKNGIQPSLSFVMGLPEETMDDVLDTLKLILKCNLIGDCFPFMQVLSPLPGTPVLEKCDFELTRLVSTAFSNGIEFNNGNLLEEDTKLILKYPKIFSVFFNIPNKYENINFISELSKNYCLIVGMFPYIYFYLTIELGLNEIELYLKWKKWLISTKNVPEKLIANLDRSKLWGYFFDFLSDSITNQKQLTYEVIPDLFKYQAMFYKVNSTKNTNNLTKHNPISFNKRTKISLSSQVFLESFKYDINKIIEDLKSHKYMHYSEQKCYMLVTRKKDEVKQYIINEKLYYLLENASNTTYESLYKKYNSKFFIAIRHLLTEISYFFINICFTEKRITISSIYN